MLEARILPAERRSEIVEVTFFADGRVVCRSTNVERPQCAWDAGPVVKPHQIRVVATASSGARVVATRRTREIDVNEAVSVKVVQVNALVSDRSGKFISGLTADQFRVREDGTPQKILHFADEQAPLEIVVAMDISGSMGAAIEDLKTAVRQFIARLKPTDQVTLVAFNQEMFVLAQRESDQAKLSAAIDRLTAWGGTTLYDVDHPVARPAVAATGTTQPGGVQRWRGSVEPGDVRGGRSRGARQRCRSVHGGAWPRP